MSVVIRKAATAEDLKATAKIYEEIHTEEEAGRLTIGWRRGIYPTEADARRSIENKELFVLLCDGEIAASAKINKEQMPAYAEVNWSEDAPDSEVMVLHTLTVSPRFAKRGLATKFVQFYESYAMMNGCRYLRIDTNERNTVARAMYKKLGYTEAGIIPCVFNNLKNVNLVCLEKTL